MEKRMSRSNERNVKLLVVGDYIGLLLVLDLQPVVNSRFLLLDCIGNRGPSMIEPVRKVHTRKSANGKVWLQIDYSI